MTKYYIDEAGRYLGGFDGAKPPEGSIEIDAPPTDGRNTWNGTVWVSYEKNLGENLIETESVSVVARKLEEIIDHIENGAELSQHAIDWMQSRKDMR